ncbi:MAG: hypothetical protein Q7K16_02790 [Candidatus Azambacteria bacterium]|nr:hypothetical protein [Candidatus Azambacteria bacterium]
MKKIILIITLAMRRASMSLAVVAPAVIVPEPSTPSVSLVAAVGNTFTLGTGNMLVGILVGLIIFAVIIYLMYILVRYKI